MYRGVKPGGMILWGRWKSLLFQMIARMSMVATMAFIFSQIKLFRQVNYRYAGRLDKVKIALVFGLIGIGETYVGIPIHDAFGEFTCCRSHGSWDW